MKQDKFLLIAWTQSKVDPASIITMMCWCVVVSQIRLLLYVHSIKKAIVLQVRSAKRAIAWACRSLMLSQWRYRWYLSWLVSAAVASREVFAHVLDIRSVGTTAWCPFACILVASDVCWKWEITATTMSAWRNERTQSHHDLFQDDSSSVNPSHN